MNMPRLTARKGSFAALGLAPEKSGKDILSLHCAFVLRQAYVRAIISHGKFYHFGDTDGLHGGGPAPGRKADQPARTGSQIPSGGDRSGNQGLRARGPDQ